MYLILAIAVTFLGMHANLTEAEAGLRITVTESTLQKVNEVELQALRNHLNGVRFPDLSGNIDVTSWQISNIHISYVGTFTPEINLRSCGLIVWTCLIHRLSLSANWWARQTLWFGPISSRGSVTATVDGISIQTSLTLSESSGSLAIMPGNCDVQIDQLRVHFSSREPLLDIVLNILSEFFKNDLKRLVSLEIRRHVEQGIRALATDMEQIHVTFPIIVIGFPLTLDNSFTKVTISNNKISTYHKGAIQWKDKTFKTSASSLFPTVRTTFGIAFDVREDVFNNLLEAIVDTGLLDGIISYSRVMQSKWHELFLTCEPSKFCLGNILKTTAAQYPDRVIGMRWSVKSAHLSIRQGQIVGEVRGRVNFSADSKSESMPLFSASIDLDVTFQMKFSSGSLSCRAVDLGGNITIDQSNIGKVLTPQVIAVTNLLFLPGFKEDLLRLINALDTDYTLQLPSNVSFQSSRLMLYEGVVRIETDLCYRTYLYKSVTTEEWVGSGNIANFSVSDIIKATTTTTSTTTTTTITTTTTTTTTTTEPTATATSSETSTTAPTSTASAAISAGTKSTSLIPVDLPQTLNTTNAGVRTRLPISVVILLCHLASVFAVIF